MKEMEKLVMVCQPWVVSENKKEESRNLWLTVDYYHLLERKEPAVTNQPKELETWLIHRWFSSLVGLSLIFLGHQTKTNEDLFGVRKINDKTQDTTVD